MLPMPPGPLGIDPPAIPTDTPTAANAPPATSPVSLGVLKQVQNEFADYKIEGQQLFFPNANVPGA